MQRALHDNFFLGKFNIRIESLEGANGNSEILSSAANLLERVLLQQVHFRRGCNLAKDPFLFCDLFLYTAINLMHFFLV